MERTSRRDRRLIQGASDRIVREMASPVEFACCGACANLIEVYPGEDGPTKPCPRCAWTRYSIGGSWGWRDSANVR